MRLGEVRISIIYLLICTLWITISDRILFLFRNNLSPTEIEIIAISKGFFFVLISACLLWYLIRRNNKRLIESEKQYRLIYEGGPLPKWIYDPLTFKFVSVNDVAVDTYGYSREEFLAMNIMDIRPSEDRMKVIESAKSVSTDLKQSGVWTHIKANGSRISVAISSQQIIFNNKPHVMVSAQNITDKLAYEQELKRLNNELKEEKRKLSETQQLAKIGGWEFYPNSQQLIWSDEMYFITGVKPQDGLNLFDLYVQQVHPDDRPAMTGGLHALITTGKPMDVIHRITFLNGQMRYIRQLAHLALDEDGKPHKVIGSAQDITELKQMEQERNKYLFNLEDTLNSINEGFYTLDHDLVITKVNKRFELETGLISADVVGKNLKDAFPGIEGRLTYKQYKRVLRDNVTVRFEAYWRHFKKWHYVEAYPTAEGIAVYFIDITEKKEKDIQLEMAVSRYETVSKATHDVIYDYDMLNNHIAFYTDVTSLLECGIDDVGSTVEWWRGNVHPDDVHKVIESQLEVIGKGETNWKCEYRIKCGDDYKHVYSQGYYIYNAANQPVRIIGAVKDIDELKKANEENKRLADIITKINNMVILMDVDHRVTWANKAFEDYAGYKLDEIKGRSPGEFLGSDKLPPGTIDEIRIRKGNLETFTIDLTHYLRNGTTQWVNVEYTPLFDDGGKHTGYIAVHKNITTRKEREDKIYKQNKVLQEISWLSSHEIRRPVASILGLAYLAADVKEVEEKEQIIGMITTCAEELDGIVHTITNKISNELYTGKDCIVLEPLD